MATANRLPEAQSCHRDGPDLVPFDVADRTVHDPKEESLVTLHLIRPSRRARLSILALALVLPGVGVAQAKPITGKFLLAGKEVPVREIAAFRIRNQFDPRSFETYVLLSAEPVDRAAIGSSLDPYTMAINDPAVMHSDFLAFNVAGDGKIDLNAHLGGTQYVDSSGKIMGQRGSLIASCRENTATRVACSVKTEKPVQSMDGPAWSVDLSFETEVTSRPAGKPLPSDGGEAGKALLALRAAVGGKDLAKILALLAEEEAEDYRKDWRSPEENLQSAKSMLDNLLPKKPKITGGELLAEDDALLEVEGVPYENGRMLYLVEMRKVEGRWVYSSSSVAGMLK